MPDSHLSSNVLMKAIMKNLQLQHYLHKPFSAVALTVPVALYHLQRDHGDEAFPQAVKLAQLSLCSFLQVAKRIGAMWLCQKVLW